MNTQELVNEIKKYDPGFDIDSMLSTKLKQFKLKEETKDTFDGKYKHILYIEINETNESSYPYKI